MRDFISEIKKIETEYGSRCGSEKPNERVLLQNLLPVKGKGVKF